MFSWAVLHGIRSSAAPARGIAVASFTLAVDRDYAPKDGGARETDFIDIVAWRSTAEFVSKYFSKGRMAVVSGRLQIRPWEDKDGNKRRSAEVVADNVYFGESKRVSESSGGYSAGNGYNTGQQLRRPVALWVRRLFRPCRS